MNLQTASYILTRARVYLGDVILDGKESKFSDQELLDFLNDGIEDAQDLKRKLFRHSILLDIKANQKYYDISDHLLNVRRVSYKEQCNMDFIDHKTLDNKKKGWASCTGLPYKIVYDYTNPSIFRLYPIPEEDDYQALIIFGDKKLKRIDLGCIDQLLDIDDRLYKPLIHYVVAEASSIRSVNTDKCDSKDHRAKYELYIGKVNAKVVSQDTDASLQFDYDNGFRCDEKVNYCGVCDINPEPTSYTVPHAQNSHKFYTVQTSTLKNGLELNLFGIEQTNLTSCSDIPCQN